MAERPTLLLAEDLNVALPLTAWGTDTREYPEGKNRSADTTPHGWSASVALGLPDCKQDSPVQVRVNQHYETASLDSILQVPRFAYPEHSLLHQVSGETSFIGPDSWAPIGQLTQGFETPETAKLLEQHWRVEVGEGYSTPLVVKDRISPRHASQGDDEVLWSLERETGEVIWRKSLPVAFVAGRNGETMGSAPNPPRRYMLTDVFSPSASPVC